MNFLVSSTTGSNQLIPRLVAIGSIVTLGVLLVGCPAVEAPPPEDEAEEQAQEEEETEDEQAAEETEEETTEDVEVIEMPQAVKEYIELARQPYQAPEGREKYKHEYTAERFRAFAKALEASSEVLESDDETIQQASETLQQSANGIQRDWKERHSDKVRNAALTASNGLNALEPARGDIIINGKQDSVRTAAESIDPETLYLQQKDRAVSYFRATADMFEKLFS